MNLGLMKSKLGLLLKMLRGTIYCGYFRITKDTRHFFTCF